MNTSKGWDNRSYTSKGILRKKVRQSYIVVKFKKVGEGFVQFRVGRIYANIETARQKLARVSDGYICKAGSNFPIERKVNNIWL